jgi:uracil-DNA glycosylase
MTSSTTTTRVPLRDQLDPGWADALEPVSGDIAAMGDFLRAELAAGRRYLPAGPNILRAFTQPFSDVRVLIVGQDPYPTPGHPVGLSFSVAPDVRPIPRSLQNIYAVSTTWPPDAANGDLTPWTANGVFLLNRVLTVAPGASGSHRGKGV